MAKIIEPGAEIPPPARTCLPRSVRGVALMVTAVFFFVVMDAVVKYLARTYPVPQIVWARYCFHILTMGLLLFPRFGVKLFRTRRIGLQVWRSLLLLAATFLFFTAISFIPLADAGAISIVSPLLVTALSVWLLKERVGVPRWLAVVVGFCGALIVLRPGLGVMHPASLLVLGTAVCFALYQITTRQLSGTESPYTTLFYTALVGTVVMCAVAPFVWEPPDPEGWGLMILIGFLGAIGHYALIKAFDYAQPSLLAPFNYTQLIWATLLGFFMFGDFPDRWTILGALVVASSGLFVLHREHRVVAAA